MLEAAMAKSGPLYLKLPFDNTVIGFMEMGLDLESEAVVKA
jgi:hypothetical protein